MYDKEINLNMQELPENLTKMLYCNYININDNEKDNAIYRIIPIYRLLEIFSINKMTLVKPFMWDDPFENFILSSFGHLSTGEKISFGMRDKLYGQCWTLNKETDAMWRIYSPEKNGVKIKTNISKLFESLYNSVGEYKEIACFIGKVEYINKNDIEKFFNKINAHRLDELTDSTGSSIAKTLLFKLRTFAHEREIRLIYFNHLNDVCNKKFQYSINPFHLFDEIVFDPRINNYCYEPYKELLISKGFKGKIFQSNLYKSPKPLIINFA